MIEPTRELLAYTLISSVLLIGGAWLGVALRQRQRRRLRRRGIKRYEH